ncbi:MAG: PhzF family phenazine biosynthesis protein [Acidimicrobiales bacterium]
MVVRSFELFGIDAFTDRPFAGNPAAVVLLDDAPWPEDGWLQSVAAEMNLSETAFVRAGGGDRFGLRWFTPATEVDLCGHATVATAHALWQSGRLDPAVTARFDTRSGELSAAPLGDGSIELDFPALPPEPTDPPSGLFTALGISPTGSAPGAAGPTVLRSRFDLLVVLEDRDAVAALRPDPVALRAVACRGVIVTAAAGPQDRDADGEDQGEGDGDGDGRSADFVSRFFAPRAGVDEDPVTGSAHCVLTPFWSAQLGRDTLRARQLSARGGWLRLALRGDRVGIAGRAVTVHRGRPTV